MQLPRLGSLGRPIRALGSWVPRPPISPRAQAVQRLNAQVAQASLDLGRQTELLWDAAGVVVDVGSKALLLRCPEWNAVAVVRPSAASKLERTQLRLSSPILQWLEGQGAPVTRWAELVVLPQFQAVSSEERRWFEQMEAEILAPMRVDGALSAVLVLGMKGTGSAYTSEELELLATIGQTAARGVENARMYAVQQARVLELQSASDARSGYILAISHQLKTPIAAVKASVEMLSDSPDGSPDMRRRLLNSIVHGVDSLDRLVTEMAEYGRMRHAALELNKVETNICSIVAETCALLQPLVDEKGLHLQVETPSTLPWVMVDPHRVQQILSNLLANAIKFTPSGGEISVRVSRDGDRLLTQVQDNGPGVPESQQQGIFEAFQGGSNGGQGSASSGLGLAIAKALTELHGGSIWLESQEGKGSTFSFSLPVGFQ